MTIKIKAGFVAILLLIGISCSKENTNSTSSVSAQASDELQGSELQSAIDESSPFAVKGDWTFYYDWYCTGVPPSTTMKFKKNGTFLTGFGETGQWISESGIVAFHFDGLNTTYSGKTKSGQITGIFADYQTVNTQGCFYMTKGIAKGFKEDHIPGQPYASGKK